MLKEKILSCEEDLVKINEEKYQITTRTLKKKKLDQNFFEKKNKPE